METLVLFGNCQAEALASALASHPGVAGRYELVCVRSYEISAEQEAELLSEDVRARCTILLEQVTPLVRISNRFAFTNARITTFQSLDFNLLWPLRAHEERMRPEPPRFPYGRFTYGDRIINQLIAEGVSGDEAWQEYQRRAEANMPDVKRLAVVEQRRWEFAERDLDVKMSDVIFPYFRESRLFWTYNHPNRLILCRLAARILASAGLALSEEEGFAAMAGILTWEFGADYHAPIHPRAGHGLELAWWSEDMPYRRYEDVFDYETFIRNQIAWV